MSAAGKFLERFSFLREMLSFMCGNIAIFRGQHDYAAEIRPA